MPKRLQFWGTCFYIAMIIGFSKAGGTLTLGEFVLGLICGLWCHKALFYPSHEQQEEDEDD